MELTNLAQPNWLNIPCNKTFFGDTICLLEKHDTVTDINYPENLFVPNRDCVILRNATYWFSKKDPFEECESRQHLGNLKIIFQAIKMVFPPLAVCKHVITSQKYANLIETISNNRKGKHLSSEGLFVSVVSNCYNDFQNGSVFECSAPTFISMFHVCDSIPDCPKGEDENNCTCNDTGKYSTKCKHLISSDKLLNTKCSVFYFLDRKNNCQMYRSNNAWKQPDILDDENHQFSCNDVDGATFKFYDICKYRLNQNQKLIPCSAGEHLQQCSDMQCKDMYKCARYYCIPWTYFCDAKWDCPGGSDENQLECILDRKCLHMFLCKANNNVMICTHLGDVCDGKRDCPLGDDEHFCLLQLTECPFPCQCLGYSIRCYNASIASTILPFKPFFLAIVFEKCNFSDIPDKLRSLDKALVVSLTEIGLTDLCMLMSKVEVLKIGNFAANQISSVSTECFRSSKILILKVNQNTISKIGDRAFSSFDNLTYLDLSDNLLNRLSHLILPGSSKLFFFSIENNALADLKYLSFSELNVEFLKTSDYKICCIVPSNVVCTVPIPWYISCKELLPSFGINLCFYFVSAVVVLANVVSLLAHKMKGTITSQDKTHAFKNCVRIVNGVDLTCGVHLVLLWICALIFGANIIIFEAKWRSSKTCFFLFELTLMYHIVSPALLCYLSVLRLMVVLHPLESKFKENSFVLKPMILIMAIGFFISICVTTTTALWTEIIPFSLCSPFFDPTHSYIILHINTWFVASLQLLSICFICCAYGKLILEVMESQEAVMKSTSKQKSHTQLKLQLFFVIGFDMLTWIPSSTIHILSHFIGKFPTEIVLWTAVAISPVNSIVNPIVFVATTLKSRASEKH